MGITKNGIPFRCFSNVFPKGEFSANDYNNDNDEDNYTVATVMIAGTVEELRDLLFSVGSFGNPNPT